MWRLSLIEISTFEDGKIKKRVIEKDLFCRKAYISFLEKLGEVIIKYEDYKKISSNVDYAYEVNCFKGSYSRLCVLSKEMIMEATERHLAYIEEEKLKKRLHPV